MAAMEPRVAGYVGAGAGSEDTMRANLEAFRRRRIVPRMLRDVAARDLSTTVLGTAMPAPLMLAPIGVQKIVHEDGELATARAAAAVGTPMIASTASHFTLEEIAAAGGEAPRWFQLYWANDPRLVASFVGRAERAGYGAIVVTVDTFVPGWKPRDLQQAWLPFLNGMGVGNYFQDPVFREALEQTPEEDQGAATGHFLGVQANPSLTWDDLGLLREMTSLPILVKGIQQRRRRPRGGAPRPRRDRRLQPRRPPGRRRDRLARRAGPRSPRRSASELAILFDSGVRGGADVLKALALGADAVCLGRPYIWGLALEGQAGVEAVLKMILAELDLTMALCGLTPARGDRTGPAEPCLSSRFPPPGDEKCERGGGLEVAAGEDEGGQGDDAEHVGEGPDDQPRTGRLRAAERAELEDDPGEARGFRDQGVQAGRVEALERQRPARHPADRVQRVGVDRVADLGQQPGGQAGAEDHEDDDPLRRHREEDREQQRDRGDDRDARASASAGPRRWSGDQPPVARVIPQASR